MPGFNIGGGASGGGGGQLPSATKQTVRSHTFKIVKLGPLTERDMPTLYARNLKLPEVSFDEETVNGGSLVYKFPKIAKFDDIEVSFYDAQDLYDQLRKKWIDLMWSPEGGLRPVSNALSTCTFHAGYDGQGYTVECFNCWPKRITHADLSYDKSDIKVINLVISCSHIKVIADIEGTSIRGGSEGQTAKKPPKPRPKPGQKLQGGKEYLDRTGANKRGYDPRAKPDQGVATRPSKNDQSFEAYASGSALADINGAAGITQGL